MDRRDFIKLSGAALLAACGPKLGSTVTTPAQLLFDERQLFFDRSGRMFVVDLVENTVSGGATLTGFNNPVSLAFNGRGDIHVLDRGNHRVKIFDTAGSELGMLDGFAMPSDIAIDSQDRVLVVDTLHHRLQIFASGALVQTVDGLNAPRSVVVFPDDSWWVLDSGNARIVKSDGGEIPLASPRRVVIGRSMAVDRNSQVYVADIALRGLHVYDKDGAFIEHRLLDRDPLLLTADASGDVHVAA